jgi:hypothetical protein
MLGWRTGGDQMGEGGCESERDGGENADGGEGGDEGERVRWRQI